MIKYLIVATTALLVFSGTVLRSNGMLEKVTARRQGDYKGGFGYPAYGGLYGSYGGGYGAYGYPSYGGYPYGYGSIGYGGFGGYPGLGGGIYPGYGGYGYPAYGGIGGYGLFGLQHNYSPYYGNYGKGGGYFG